MILCLNALGVATPLGRGKADVASALFSGDRSGLLARDDLVAGRTVRVGSVLGSLPAVPDRLCEFDSRNNRLALAALHEIESDITGAVKRYGSDRVAVVMGTSTSGLADGEDALAGRQEKGMWPHGFSYSQQELGSLGEFVSAYLGTTGPAFTIATACSSSAKAFASAQRLIAADFCDAAVVGGVDSLCRMTLSGFAALELLAKDFCVPFSDNRDGINIGEGAAIFLMTREPSTVALLGVGENSDAHHVSAPDPHGNGAIEAMRLALDEANLPIDAIDYINFHGTATRLNDIVEGNAVARLFGNEVPTSSTKAISGHMLGAAGAAEAAFLWLTLNLDYSDGLLPPHIWDGVADPNIAPLTFVERGRRLAPKRQSAMLSNSFAFGGSNACIILGRGW